MKMKKQTNVVCGSPHIRMTDNASASSQTTPAEQPPLTSEPLRVPAAPAPPLWQVIGGVQRVQLGALAVQGVALHDCHEVTQGDLSQTLVAARGGGQHVVHLLVEGGGGGGRCGGFARGPGGGAGGGASWLLLLLLLLGWLLLGWLLLG